MLVAPSIDTLLAAAGWPLASIVSFRKPGGRARTRAPGTLPDKRHVAAAGRRQLGELSRRDVAADLRR